MDCAQARELISAALDGEASDDEVRASTLHLEGCAPCQAWRLDAGIVARQLRVRPAAPVPDLTPRVMAAVPTADVQRWPRLFLVAIAVFELVMGVSNLLPASVPVVAHDPRHIGPFGVATAVGFLLLAWRPGWAKGSLPFMSPLAVVMITVVVGDLLSSHARWIVEGHHLIEIAGFVLVWMLAGMPLPRRGARTASGDHARSRAGIGARWKEAS